MLDVVEMHGSAEHDGHHTVGKEYIAIAAAVVAQFGFDPKYQIATVQGAAAPFPALLNADAGNRSSCAASLSGII